MKKTYIELKKRKNIVIWGTGTICDKYYDRLDPALEIVSFCDSDEHKWCDNYKAGRPCISKDDLSVKHTVLIAIGSLESIDVVSTELNEKGIDYCHITEAAKEYLHECDRIAVEQCSQKEIQIDKSKIVRYIDCYLPYENCNLRCNYCYIRQVRNFGSKDILQHTPSFIRKALSVNRLGGACLINFCAGGETLLYPGIVKIIGQLVKEGHYVSIVTNGTITKSFDEILDSDMDLSRIFIKFSFHYLELKRLYLLEQFANNVKRMWDAGCSMTIEVMADDKSVPYISEIKEFSQSHFGALPHCLIPRNDTSEALDILTDMPLEEYRKIWDGTFCSAIYDFKMSIIGIKRKENCMAGDWSVHMNLETGDIFKCIGGHPWLDNIYRDINFPIHFEKVGTHCCLPYCYNGHAYLALGDIEGVDAPTYYQLRDRETSDGRHWVTDTMKHIFEQKLYVNNTIGERKRNP